jgi:hypothetical protein
MCAVVISPMDLKGGGIGLFKDIIYRTVKTAVEIVDNYVENRVGCAPNISLECYHQTNIHSLYLEISSAHTVHKTCYMCGLVTEPSVKMTDRLTILCFSEISGSHGDEYEDDLSSGMLRLVIS